MAIDLHTNFAYSNVVATAPGAAGTTLPITAGTGTRFPDPPFNLVIWPEAQQPLPTNAEIVRVTVAGTDTFTITRTQEGTSARTIVVGDQVALAPTAKWWDDVERPLQIPKKISSLTFIGHSYLAGATQGDVGVSNAYQETIAARIMAMLKVHEDNVIHLGIAASTAVGFGLTTAWGGWKGVYQFIWPSNSKAINAASDIVVSDGLAMAGGAGIIVHGVNDFVITSDTVVADNNKRAENARRGAKNAYRAMISRLRAGALYCATVDAGVLTMDPTVAFTGTWDALAASVTANTGAGYRQSSDFTAPNGAFEITIPLNFTGGTVAVSMIAQQNGVGHLTAAMTNVQTTLPISGSGFPPAATYVVEVSGPGGATEQMLVTTGGASPWTVTRGVNGTSAVAHGQDDVVTVATNTHRIDWSTDGSETGVITGSTELGGQGAVSVCAVVKRFALTGASAGKKIIGTLADQVTGDTSAYVRFDSWWIEAEEPPPVVVTNLHDFAYVLSSGAAATQHIAAWNTMIDEVVAEFDGFVRVADVYTPYWQRNGTLQTTMNNSDSSTVVTFRANHASFTPEVGELMVFDGSGEFVRITAVSGPSGLDWTLTLERGYASSTKTTHAINDWMGPQDWMYFDRIHLNGKGHAVYAEEIYRAFSEMPSPAAYQMAGVQGNWSQGSQSWSMGIVDNGYLYTPVTATGTATPVLNTQHAVPIFIPKTCVVTEMGCSITAGAQAGGVIRYGIYLPDNSHCRPGRLLQDFGTAISTAIDTESGVTGVYQVLRPGWYWLSAVGQVTTTSLLWRSYTLNGLPFPQLMPDTPYTGASQALGITKSGISGALADWGSSFTYHQVSAAAPPRLFLRLRAAMWA